jgi:hypothetical protein
MISLAEAIPATDAKACWMPFGAVYSEYLKPELVLLPEALAVCRLDPDAPIPAWALEGALVSVTRTPQELSIVCSEAQLPAGGSGIRVERGFRAFQVVGPLDFALTGLLSALLAPLARAAIPVFVLSTFDTDLILVRVEHTERAAEALAGVAVVRRGGA